MNAVSSQFQPGSLIQSEGVNITILPPKGRFSLRVAPQGLAEVGKAIGLALPEKIGTKSVGEGLECLCLGPDEWVLLCAKEKSGEIASALDAIYKECAHSLVDISDREVTIEITGEKAVDLLTLAWPRNPESVPVGEARRTVFGGVSAVIWHDGDTAWRLNAWRSFMPHLLALLVTGTRELAAE